MLHDCHAEILAIRAFNYWLLNECRGVLAQEPGDDRESPPYVRRRSSNTIPEDNAWPPLELIPDIRIYMYCTCAPCGDASMELCMAAQEDPTPWELPEQSLSKNDDNDNETEDTKLVGRAHFSLLGVVRRKPARIDAESTRSKSCSDKLALRQVSSLLSYETSLLVAPTMNAYLEGIVLPEEEISWVACERAFGAMGRMRRLNRRGWPHDPANDREHGNHQPYGYRFRPFHILPIPAGQIEVLWSFRKPSKQLPPTSSLPSCPSETQPSTDITASSRNNNNKKSKPGNISAIWTIAPSHSSPLQDHNPKSLPTLCGSNTGVYENIINGVKQGNRATVPLARGASALSRARLWGLAHDIIGGLEGQGGVESGGGVLRASTYREFKGLEGDMTLLTRGRGQAIKDTRQELKGWVPNSGDEEWGLDVLVDPKRQKR